MPIQISQVKVDKNVSYQESFRHNSQNWLEDGDPLSQSTELRHKKLFKSKPNM